MADIKLGLTKAAIENAKDTYDGPRTPFPANAVGYTKHTATVTDIQIKEGSGKTEGKAWLWIQVTNGIHQESLLVNLDPSDVAPSITPDKIEGTIKRNLDTLLRAIKVLEISNPAGDGIDTTKFASAIGTAVSFGVKQGKLQDNGYHRYMTTFYGKAEEVIPVVDSLVSTESKQDDSDIPF